MTPSTGHDPPKAGLSAHRQGPEDVFDEFVSSISRFCNNKGFQRLRTIILDYNTLQKKLSDTKTAYDKNLEELTRLIVDRNAEKEGFKKKIEEQTKQHSKVLEDKAAAYRKLKTKQSTTTTLKEKIKSLKEDVKRSITTSKKHEERITKLDSTISGQDNQLKAAKEEATTLTSKLQSTSDQLGTKLKALTMAENKLATFRSYTAILTPLEDVRVDISEMFASSFEDALTLFREFLGRDVDGAQLQDTRSWDRIRDHVAIQRTIPLPASNSVHGKRMRVIAGLVIYARALSRYVFRPTYLSMGTDAEEVLDALPAVNPSQDTLVRAVLLEVLPDQQTTHRDTCVERVVEEVVAALAGLVPADQHATFKSRLSHLTSLLCGNWQRVQRLHERVEPCFVFETPDDWQPLPTWIDPVPSDSSARAAPPRHGNREPEPRQKGLEPAALSTSDILKVVWPAFLANSLEQPAGEEGGTSDLVYHGFVLTHAEVRGAANEETPRRAIRRATRNTNAAAQKKRRDSAVFLSPGASDGLDVK